MGGKAEALFQKLVPEAIDANKYWKKNNPVFDFNYKEMTVAELRDFLEDYDDETPVYLSFDNGYTYGGITESNFELEESYDEED